MALSNIAREPRRELTEQFVGALVLFVPAWIIYEIARSMERSDGSHAAPFGLYLMLATLTLVLSGFVIAGLMFLMHALGEGVCNFIADRWIEIRPKKRY